MQNLDPNNLDIFFALIAVFAILMLILVSAWVHYRIEGRPYERAPRETEQDNQIPENEESIPRYIPATRGYMRDS